MKLLCTFSLLCLSVIHAQYFSQCVCDQGYYNSGGTQCPAVSKITCSLCTCPDNQMYRTGCNALTGSALNNAPVCDACMENTQAVTNVVNYQTGCKANPGYYGVVTGQRWNYATFSYFDLIYPYPTQCSLGDYCASVGTLDTNKACPAGYYCPDVLTKIACAVGKYCPAGSTAEQPIPSGSCCPDPATKIDCVAGDYCLADCVVYQKCIAGSYCPTLTTRVPCALGQFCPQGSAAAQACPVGFFCPKPSVNTSCTLGNYCPSGSTINTCPMGFYCPSFTQKTACVAGELCPANTPNAVKCPVGSYCPDFVNSYQCSVSSYCPLGSSTNSPCPAGSYCVNASISVLCAPGQTCPAGTTSPSICPAGSLCSTPATQVPCPAGQYCAAGTTQASNCSLGQYCPSGTSTPAPCDAGYYCANPSTRQVCAAGQYCLAGSTIPTSCPSGSYCQTTSAAPVPCPPGSFCSIGVTTPSVCSVCISGQKYMTSECNATTDRQCTSCDVCPSGQYETVSCQGAQNRQCSGCPAGFYCPSQFEKYSCPVNYYCPVNSKNAIPCLSGQISLGGSASCFSGSVYSKFYLDNRNGDVRFGPDGSTPYPQNMDQKMGNLTISNGSHTVNGYVIPRGIQVWRVGKTGKYNLVAAGGRGGIYGHYDEFTTSFARQYRSGYAYGIVTYTIVNLNAGDIICMLVGQKSNDNFNFDANKGTGSGGGTFITKYSATGAFSSPSQHSVILVAGGGGGSGEKQYWSYKYTDGSPRMTIVHPQLQTNGQRDPRDLIDMHPIVITSLSQNGGGGPAGNYYLQGGNGGDGGSDNRGYSSGGGGFSGNGGVGNTDSNGKSFLNGGMGGICASACTTYCAHGAFGGGAGSSLPGGVGGAGGYSGGSGSMMANQGGCGGSYDWSGPPKQFMTWYSALGAQPSSFLNGQGYNDGNGFISIASCEYPFDFVDGLCVCGSGTYGGNQSANLNCEQCVTGKYGTGSNKLSESEGCANCPSNTNSVFGTADITGCTANAGYTGSGNSVAICPANSYCPTSSTTNPCPANTQSPAGSISLTSCTANQGYYGTPGSVPTLCPAGFSCGSGATTPTPCPLGTLCPSGSGSPSPCAPGSYCPNTTVQIACSSGSYCAGNSSAQSACPAGYFCATPSTITICPASRFCPLSSTAGTLCSAGTFSNVTGLSACFPCPYSTYASAQGATACTACNTVTNPGTFRQGCGGSNAGTLVQCTN